MANYNDISLGATWTPIPVAAENTFIYAADGPVRITSHTSPSGNTLGVGLDQDEAYPISANVALFAKSATAISVTLVRNSA